MNSILKIPYCLKAEILSFTYDDPYVMSVFTQDLKSSFFRHRDRLIELFRNTIAETEQMKFAGYLQKTYNIRKEELENVEEDPLRYLGFIAAILAKSIKMFNHRNIGVSDADMCKNNYFPIQLLGFTDILDYVFDHIIRENQKDASLACVINICWSGKIESLRHIKTHYGITANDIREEMYFPVITATMGNTYAVPNEPISPEYQILEFLFRGLELTMQDAIECAESLHENVLFSAHFPAETIAKVRETILEKAHEWSSSK